MCHKHEQIRTFAVDELRSVDWLKGQRFDYPRDYDPTTRFASAFGVTAGAAERVRIKLRNPEVVRRARRRRWHPSQRLRNVAGGAILTLRVHPSAGLENWILGFGAAAEVLEPAHLRRTIAERLSHALQLYTNPESTD